MLSGVWHLQRPSPCPCQSPWCPRAQCSPAREATAVRTPCTTSGEYLLLATTRESPCSAAKTPYSQNDKYFFKKRIWSQKFPFSPLSFSLYFYKEINAFTLLSFGPLTLSTSYILYRTKSDGFWCMIPLMFTLFLMVILRCNRKGWLREAFWDFF